MTFVSLDLQTDVYTFLNSEGQALEMTPAQVFNYAEALDALPLPHQTLLSRKLMISATNSA